MTVDILQGDCVAVLKTLDSNSVHTCVTSPPYFGLRDYGVDGQIGLEQTPEDFVNKLVSVFREVRRVLRDDGTLWLNLGDSYARQAGDDSKKDPSTINTGYSAVVANGGAKKGNNRPPSGLKAKDLIGIPWRVAFALQADGWYLRQDIIWHKPNPMPESVQDRCTKAHEYIFLLSKSPKYYFDSAAMKEPVESVRPQRARAKKLAAQHGLTAAHLEAVRSIGRAEIGGKAYETMTGAGNNAAQTQRLADEAKAVLGGYFREFTFNDTRNRRSVWTVNTRPYKGAHFATFPPALIEPCVLAGAPEGGLVLDPFGGSGTTGVVANKLNRNAVLVELNPEYISLAHRRITEAK